MKKKILSIMLTLSMFATFMPCIASAETYGDFEYERNGSGITITEYDGNGGDIEIPAEIDGLPVTKIGVHAFYQARVKNVTIPNSVTTIEHDAFSCCNDLISVTIPDSVTTIGKQAFLGCEALTDVIIPESVINLGDYAFAGCYALKNVTILDGITKISECMFNGCRNLEKIIIPNSVTSIDTFAFNCCTSLTDIIIPDSVTTIGNGAFRTCISLTDVTIPNSVMTIEKEAFLGCDALTNVTIPDSVMTIGENAFNPQLNIPEITADNNASAPTETPEPTPVPTPAPTDKPSDEPVHPINPVPTAKPTETPQVNAFVDVPKTHWAYDNIMRITALGGFTGYEDGTFKPDNQITHEEFLTVVMKLTYNGDVNAAPVSTLNANWADWAKATLNAAVDAGIVTAEDADLLAVNTPITRAEMAKIISRTLDYLGKTKATNLDTGKITDWNTVPADYQLYVAEVYAKGIISGYEDGSFGPANCLTRAEASAVIVRMIDAQ